MVYEVFAEDDVTTQHRPGNMVLGPAHGRLQHWRTPQKLIHVL